MVRKKNTDVNILYLEDGFRSRAGHWVRTSEEAMVCSWLERREVAHRHACEMFHMNDGQPGAARVYIPSIILTEPLKTGKKLVIEPLDAFGLTEGKLKLLEDFRVLHSRTHYLVAVVGKQNLRKVPKRSRDLIIALEELKALDRILPAPERER